MEGPWYGDGLRFSCTGCGACCTGPPGYVWVKEAEIQALAEHLGVSVEAFSRRHLRRVGTRYSLLERANGDCVFYRAGRGCTVYSARPLQCRTFPFWPENLRTRSAWEDVESKCPGSGKGRLFPLSEIQLLSRGKGEA